MDVATAWFFGQNQLTQHAASHQDVKECLCIPAVVELGARGIKELCDRFQISASLIQALYDTFLKLSRVKPLLFIWREQADELVRVGIKTQQSKNRNVNIKWR